MEGEEGLAMGMEVKKEAMWARTGDGISGQERGRCLGCVGSGSNGCMAGSLELADE